jgi:hypothetical protein
VSILGKLFGTDKAVEGVINAGSKLLDEAFHTDQEKSAEEREATLEMVRVTLEWIQGTSGSRLARRVLAFGITGLWGTLKVSTMLMGVWAVWLADPQVASQIHASIAVIQTETDQMNAAVTIILGFYFAAPYMGNVAEKALTRFSGGSK